MRHQRSAAERFTGTVGAIGPGSSSDTGHLILYANVYHEVGAVNWPKGNKLVLRLQYFPIVSEARRTISNLD